MTRRAIGSTTITARRRKRAEGRLIRDDRVTVRHVGKYYLAQLFVDNKARGQAACLHKRDIGWMCAELCRWDQKMGSSSDMTSSARERMNKRLPYQVGPRTFKGRVWIRIWSMVEKLDETKR